LITWVTYGVSLVPSPGVYRESEPTQPRIPDGGEDIWRSNESFPTFSNPGWGTATQQATPNRNTVTQNLNTNPIRGTVPQQRVNNPVRPTAPQQTIRNTDPPQTFRNNEERVSQETASSEEYPCGRERRQKTITSPLIYQGTSLERGQLPWLVAIFERRESNGPRFICGGSLISTSTVLSAAHCFRVPGKDLPADRLAISLGRNTLAIHSPGEYRGVSQLIIHDKFNVAQFTEADLALVRLDSPVE